MTYKFQSKAAGDVLMIESVGDAVLNAMGIAPAAQGIITPTAMAAAMRALEAAVALSRSGAPRAEAAQAETGGEPAEADDIPLRQRAWPMLQMLERAQAAGEPIVWGV